MKAIQYEQYGPPEVLKLKEVDKPVPADNEVLVKVHASSVNPLDWHFMRGEPRMMRIMSGLTAPKKKILGADFAGKVEAVGSKVKLFKPGDEVFGGVALGAFAEYVCVAEDKSIALKPSNISFAEAAAIPIAALTALQGLRDYAHVKQGQEVLINGASGGVGTYMVQIAKSYGARVTGVCSTRNMEMVKSIGADDVIDYTQEDFTRREQGFDLIMCNVGNRSISDYARAIRVNGSCVIVGYTSPALLVQHMFWGPLRSVTGGKKIGLMGTAKSSTKDLLLLKELAESGKIRSVIDKTYPLGETAEAIRYLETMHARGKVVIDVK